MYRRLVTAALLAVLAICVSTPDIFAWSFFQPQSGFLYANGVPGGTADGGGLITSVTNARIWGGNDNELLIGGNSSMNMNGQATLYVGRPAGHSGTVAGLFTEGGVNAATRAEIRVDRPDSGSASATIKGGGSNGNAKIEVKGNGDVVITLP